MESFCTLPAPAGPASPARADRVVDLALRVRAAHAAAREFLRRYAIEAAMAPSIGLESLILPPTADPLGRLNRER